MDKKSKKINLGCGGRKPPGYVQVDINPLQNPDILADVSDLWMIGDEEYDEVLASHILEHFELEESPLVLEEWKRIMKPGAVIEIRVPNLSERCILYLKARTTVDQFTAPFPERIQNEPDLTLQCQAYLNGEMSAVEFSRFCFGYGDPDFTHKSIWDGASLKELMESNGLKDVEVMPEGTFSEPDTCVPGRMFPDAVVRGRKAYPVSRDKPFIKLGMVMPRRKEMPFTGFCSISKLVMEMLPYLVKMGVEPHVFSIRKHLPADSETAGVYYHRHTGTQEEYLNWVGVLSDHYELDIVEVFNRVWPIKTRAKKLIHMSNDHFNPAHESILHDISSITLISDYLMEQTKGKLPNMAGRFYRNSLGVDTRTFHPMEKDEPPVLLWVGLMDVPKGLHHFVQVANRLLKEYPDLAVKIVGATSLDANQPLNKYTLDCMDKADSKFQWLGEARSDELPEIFATASIMMTPMRAPYTWSLAIMEAQAAGVPVIATDVGGLKECVGGGIVVPKDDNVEESLYRACVELIENRELREVFGKDARKFALSHSWQKTAERAVKLYETVKDTK